MKTTWLLCLVVVIALSLISCSSPTLPKAVTSLPLAGAVHYDQNSQTWLFHGGAGWVIRWTERADGLYDYHQYAVCAGVEHERSTGSNYTLDELWEKFIIRFAQSGIDNQWMDYKTTEGTFRRELCPPKN